MTNRADVIIVGSGPAGGMAAKTLASKGFRVLLLEKQSLPRHKPCGGAFSTSAINILQQGLPFLDLFAQQATQVLREQWLLEGSDTVDIDRHSPLMLVNRQAFDYFLLEQAIKISRNDVQVLDQITVKSVKENSRTVELLTNKGRFVADYVIAADGACSRIAKSLGLRHGAKNIRAIDIEAQLQCKDDSLWRSTALFDMCAESGYAWSFPKGEALSLGIMLRGKAPLKSSVNDFLQRTFKPGELSNIAYYGHPIPIFKAEQITTRRVCLVGDAAGLVDPVLGEGIRYALQSGQMAANCILDLLLNTSSNDQVMGCASYQQAIDDSIVLKLQCISDHAYSLLQHSRKHFYQFAIKSGLGYKAYAKRVQDMTTGAKFGDQPKASDYSSF